MQLLAASPYEKGNRSCVLEFLPYEKFLALWRGSLPADLVYELQFSFNFQLPVVKDRTRLRSKSFGAVNDLQKRTLEKTANARACPPKPLWATEGFTISPRREMSP